MNEISGFWRNIKTGKLYHVFSEAINTTNALDGQMYVVYEPVTMDNLFVRERTEFIEKFEKVEE